MVADKSVSDLQSVTENQHINVLEFETEINMNLLKEVGGVISVEQIGGNNYKIISGKIDVRKGISKLALEQDWTILGMRKEEQSLENIFQTLTKKENA